ncbi:MAG: RluA family pseudouridine synthase [Patescibacteria group bacterium]|jgi:23S rRNA pseudouridine1911/1915/1917 synthase
MKNTTKFIISEQNSEQRLDIFLLEKLKISRSKVQKLVEDGLITLNGKIPKKSGNTLKSGNIIIVENTEQPKKTTVKKNTKKTTDAKIPAQLIPKIISENPDYIIIEKPSGLLTHPTMANEKISLSSWLSEKYPEIKKVGDDPQVRPGIVHRLDKEASGLMVIARTQKMFNHLKDQFKNRTIEKEYFALVHGRVARDWEILTFPIARSESGDRMAARPVIKGKVEGEKEAKTEFFVERKFVNFTLLKIILHTGRMHQIRVHFLAYNHPLVGDPLYFQKKRKRVWDDKLGRLFLHSAKLSFVDLHGERQTFESVLPKTLKNFLEELA